MVSAKLERILDRGYPDEGLLERLSNVPFLEANIPEDEFLQFRRLQSLLYQLRVAGYDIEAMQTEAFLGAIQFTQLNFEVAVTCCEYDCEIDDSIVSRVTPRLPKRFVWFTTNANVDHPNIKALPIGLTDYCGYSPYHAIIGDSAKFKRHINAWPRTEKNLVLMNFNDRTNFLYRSEVRATFKDHTFVTVGSNSLDELGYLKYVQSLRSHPFCLAPRGNGIDTHRIWECLYAGCIPIVQKTRALREFSDLPILFVDRWTDVCDPAVLYNVRDQYYGRKWDLQKLTLSYWYLHICNYLSGIPKSLRFPLNRPRQRSL
jgi:hypothetical protein